MTRYTRRDLFPNAVLGDGALLVTLSARGELEQLWWPHVDHDPHLGLLRLAGVEEDGLRWLDDDQARHRQRYLDDTSVLETTVVGDGEVVVTDHVTVDGPVLVRQVRGLRGRLAVVVRPELAGQAQGGGGYLDPVAGALVLHRRDRVLAVAMNVPATGTLGELQNGDDLLADLQAGRLRGSGVVHGEVEGALVADAEHAEVSVAIAVADTHAQAIELAVAAANGEHTAQLAARRAADAEALATIPVLVDGALAGLERRSQLVFGMVADRATGGVIAAPEQDPWFARSGGYGYVWARDLAFILLAQLSAGRDDLAVPALQWLVRAQGADGLWLQRNWTDGSLAPSWGTQLDETGAVLFAYGEALATLDADGLDALLWPSVERGADALVRVLDPVTGLPAPSMDLWEERVGLHAYTAAATWAGLQAAASIARQAGHADRGQGWEAAAARVRDGIQTHLWSEEHGHYLRSIRLARKDKAGDPVPDCYGLLPTHAQHPVGSVDPFDATVDVSLLGLAYPFGVFDATEPRMAATIAAVDEQLRAPDGGIVRYTDDRYRDGNPWVLTTLWLGLVQRAPGAAEPADGLAYALRSATSTQLLPEQVDAATGRPAWIVPLTWSHAMYVLACRPDAPALAEHRRSASAVHG
ncbi:glycoside hydrolase family 15 protein [Egicoccus sp. AB-alg2]|uniref:glycoside hydrolase family 15 protein n=1 Tax=Egicoccus sp. AB-alg2 TaxID=3242693 RepID=UPI00359E1120